METKVHSNGAQANEKTPAAAGRAKVIFFQRLRVNSKFILYRWIVGSLDHTHNYPHADPHTRGCSKFETLIFRNNDGLGTVSLCVGLGTRAQARDQVAHKAVLIARLTVKQTTLA